MSRGAFASSASTDDVVVAARKLELGKKLPGATYVHRSLVVRLPKVVREAVEAAQLLAGLGAEDYDLVKIGTIEPKISLLAYPGFWRESFPALAKSYTVDLGAGTVKVASYKQNDGTPILHRKETFIDPEDRRVPKLAETTRQLEKLGLFKDTKRIGRRGTWEQMLRDVGVTVEGNDVMIPRRNPTSTSRAFSAATSIRQVPKLHKALIAAQALAPGSINADIGGGKYDDATNALASVGVENLVIDPGNRSPAHNRAMLDRVEDGRADSATIANVLNVIPDAQVRRQVLETARNVVRPGGTVYVDCYEGDGHGVGKETSKGWQENRKLASYLTEISDVFPIVGYAKIGKGRFIVAKTDRPNPARRRARRN